MCHNINHSIEFATGWGIFMILDIRTLLITNFLYTLLIAVSFAISYNGFSGQVRQSIKTLSNAMFLMAVGWLFLGLRGFIPDFHSVLWGNLATIVGLSELINTIRVFDGKPTKRRIFYPIALLFIAANTYFYVGNDLPSVRIAIISLSSAVFSLLIAFALLNQSNYPSKIRFIGGITFLFFTLLSLARAIDSFFINFGKYSLLSNTLLQTYFLIIIFLSIFMMTFAFILMCTHRFQDELKKQTVIDPITNMYNRNGIKQFLQSKIAYAIEHKQPLCIAVFDIDNFTRFNDEFGLDMGDFALQSMASILQTYIKNEDIAGRLGGDEFIVIFTQIELSAAIKRTSEIAHEISNQVHINNGQPVHFSASYGVAMLDYDNPDSNQLIRNAHHELSKARTFSEDMYGT
jgi:diguanylate cyclase (GGDEF)-like protein